MTPESAVKRAILDYLTARHILAFRMQSGVSFAEYKGRQRAIPYGTPGMADLLAFPEVDGRPHPLWIECKTQKGKQSELQKYFQTMVTDRGHTYIVARCIEDVEATLASASLAALAATEKGEEGE
ncbi:MAG TPA: hypothetical protein VFB43_18075 [Terracidiphilus sp.]|nr:hypothetical protein [Terracidiphilus sp.]